MSIMLLTTALALPALAQTQAPAPAPTPAPGQAPAAAPAPPAAALTKCGPDHAILYKKAVVLLDEGEKKFNARYTAEAKAKFKEANALFTILQKECGPEQRQRLLTPKEEQQEAINHKLYADEQAQADRLEKSAEEKFKKAEKLEAAQPEMYIKLMQESQRESELAQKHSIKAHLYALRNLQMVFRFLAP
jgi:hypothetical protein